MSKKEFTPYEEALAIWELNKDVDFGQSFGYWYQYKGRWFIETPDSYDYGTHKNTIPAPLYQQAFRWFREKYGLIAEFNWHFPSKCYATSIYPNDFYLQTKSYDEAELACLRKLIEIVKEK